ncbi:MAG: hypothetical protein Q9211_005143 [Gyalolechia sp. 1 TL-2023]
MSSSVSKYTSILHDKRVLVIGGTSGIGFCVAEAALEYGAKVCIASSQQSKVDKKLSQLKSTYPDKASSVSGYTCDLSKPQQLESNIKTLLEAAAGDSKLDHIVFTAGDSVKAIPISETSVTVIQECGNIRFLGPPILAKYAPLYLSPGPQSSITLTGGTLSNKPMKGVTTIAAWASSIEGMTRGLAVDLAPIRVNMVSPGTVYTELFDGFMKERAGEDTPLQRYADDTLIGRMGRPEQLAEAYLYAMRDCFVTGVTITSDGGRLLK